MSEITSGDVEIAEKQPLAPEKNGAKSPELAKKIRDSAKAATSMKMTSIHTGLTGAEAQANMEKYGANEVVAIEDPEWVKIVSRYLGLIPFLMLVVSLLSACIVTTCDSGTEDLEGCSCTEARDWPSFGLLFFELNLM